MPYLPVAEFFSISLSNSLHHSEHISIFLKDDVTPGVNVYSIKVSKPVYGGS